MPNIVVREYDKTSAGIGLYANFSVLVPGYVAAGKESNFDENGVCELDSQDKFLEKVGKTTASGTIDGIDVPHYGNQIAYELLGMGYIVLYKMIDRAKTLDEQICTASWWASLKDKAVYDFRYVLTGLIDKTEAANAAIVELADFKNSTPFAGGRGDCTALLDIPSEAYKELSQSKAIDNIKASANKKFSKYAAYFAPFVVYDHKTAGYANQTFPASFHYLACAAKAAGNFNEWYAIAGYARGISDYSIASLGCVFGDAAIEALQPRHIANGVKAAVNLIAKIKNNYYIWGNRTAAELGTENTENGDLKASHFLNVRQLCTTIKKQVYVTCRRYMFDPNSDVLWINFCNDIRPLLEKMKADQGIEDYRFVKVKTDKKALLKAKIRIIPIEAVEDFDISLTLEDSISDVDVEEIE